jgi:UDP-N-acetylglucosamine 2-epimerase (non-hydrolysing)
VTRRVLVVFGTRPEAIKMAPVCRALAADPDFDARVCVTAQHREMLDPLLEFFEVRPHHDLAIMRPGQDLYDVTARVLVSMRDVLREERPERVLVHGDTTTCMAASLAAFYAEIPVAHVEAGLRTGDLSRPFPEELNRCVADRIADLFFAPTEMARANLLREGARPERVHVTGNTVVDALLWAKGRVAGRPLSAWRAPFGEELCGRLADAPERVVLITGHRRESFGQGFLDLCRAIRALSEAHPRWLFVYPVHLNPNVQRPVNEILGGLPGVVLTRPQDYAPFVWLMNRCDLILTDSGGVQEEAPVLGKPVLVMRTVTERPEAVEAGTARLVGTDTERIVAGVESVLGDRREYERMASAHNPYGDGHAAERILEALRRA